jgi:hypothetical protein
MKSHDSNIIAVKGLQSQEGGSHSNNDRSMQTDTAQCLGVSFSKEISTDTQQSPNQRHRTS